MRWRDGAADEMIEAWLASKEVSTYVAKPVVAHKSFNEAMQRIYTERDAHGTNPRDLIPELNVTDKVRERLYERFPDAPGVGL